jgi:hypothetical protein
MEKGRERGREREDERKKTILQVPIEEAVPKKKVGKMFLWSYDRLILFLDFWQLYKNLQFEG